MKAYEIVLKLGVVRVRQDEVKGLIATLNGLEQGPPVQLYSRGMKGFLGYDAAKSILEPAIGEDPIGSVKRVSRLWNMIARLASNGVVAYDACCQSCGVLLVEHRAEYRYCDQSDRRIRMVVSAQSLRDHEAAFAGELPAVYRIGRQMRQDYAYLVGHLPAE